MILLWYNSVEFYVISGAIAAAAVVAASLPKKRGQTVLHFAAGELSASDSGAGSSPASIDVWVDDDGLVHIRRHGLNGISDNGAVSLAINVIGFDVQIEERLTPGNGGGFVDTADFVLDFFAPERYHVKYNSEDAGVFTAFTLNAGAGISFSKLLK